MDNIDKLIIAYKVRLHPDGEHILAGKKPTPELIAAKPAILERLRERAAAAAAEQAAKEAARKEAEARIPAGVAEYKAALSAEDEAHDRKLDTEPGSRAYMELAKEEAEARRLVDKLAAEHPRAAAWVKYHAGANAAGYSALAGACRRINATAQRMVEDGAALEDIAKWAEAEERKATEDAIYRD